jgi:hypothetical protein
VQAVEDFTTDANDMEEKKENQSNKNFQDCPVQII